MSAFQLWKESKPAYACRFCQGETAQHVSQLKVFVEKPGYVPGIVIGARQITFREEYEVPGPQAQTPGIHDLLALPAWCRLLTLMTQT